MREELCREKPKDCGGAALGPVWGGAPVSCHFYCRVPGRHHDAQGALQFSRAGGAFYWVNGVPADAVIAHC